MFTGLIEDVGNVRAMRRGSRQARLCVATALPQDEIAMGDSIAVNGVCVTVVEQDSDSFSADVSPETLDCTNLGQLTPGAAVNLERALRLSDRLGGHLVSGHVDDVALVAARRADGNAVRFTFELAPAALRYVAAKGSVAVDGVSLTVNEVGTHSFTVAVIPHSLAQTTLKHLAVGDRVNIETDLLARYVERLLGGADVSGASTLTMEHLARNGFV